MSFRQRMRTDPGTWGSSRNLCEKAWKWEVQLGLEAGLSKIQEPRQSRCPKLSMGKNEVREVSSAGQQRVWGEPGRFDAGEGAAGGERLSGGFWLQEFESKAGVSSFPSFGEAALTCAKQNDAHTVSSSVSVRKVARAGRVQAQSGTSPAAPATGPAQSQPQLPPPCSGVACS